MELMPGLSDEKLSPGQGTEKPATRIGIVGCGSRGLTVLERLCALAAQTGRRIEISVFDPQRPGPGLHSVDQPDYLMLNTVASQISMFPDTAALGGHAGRPGPNFYEWCLRFKSAERIVRPDDFLPRRWLGEYLAWTYSEVLRSVPAHVQVTHYACAVDNIEHTDMGTYILDAQQQKFPVDWLLLTIGHQKSACVVDKGNGSTQRLGAYPQPGALSGISSTDHVGVEGLGLTAMDVVAGLTTGRGGQFLQGPEGLRYRPSGQEPQIYMFSRSGLPYRTRPDITPHRVAGAALIFTLSAVADLRARYPQGLDFEAQVLPLIKAEMLAEYFGMIAAQNGESAARIKSELARAFYCGQLDLCAAQLAMRFDAPQLDEAVYNPRYTSAPVANYPQWIRDAVELDVEQSALGLDASPLKAAVEVWRSCREQLRRIVDNNGLTPDSHRIFFNEYAPLVNRMVAGPQKERHQELIALADAGIVHWVHHAQVMHRDDGDTVSVNVACAQDIGLNSLIRAHGEGHCGKSSLPAVVKKLMASGVVHSLNDGDVVSVDSHGKAQPNLWITGPLVEGATYYNHYVPSSGSYSRAFVDADRIAREMLGVGVDVKVSV